MNNLFIKKFKLSNISLLLQIVLINLVFIIISFVFFGLINFYIISKDLSLEDKKIKLDNLGNDLVQSIVNGAIKTTFYTSKKGEITRNLCTNPVKIKDGYAYLPKEPGLGVVPNNDIIEKYKA